MLGKYKPLSYFLKMKGWVILSKMMITIYLMLPIVFLRYYFELHNMLTIDLYQMLFYSVGSYVYSLPLAYLGFMVFKAPLDAWINIHKEAALVRKGEKILRFDYQFINCEKLKFKRVKMD